MARTGTWTEYGTRSGCGSGSGTPLSRMDVKLDSFLKRNTTRAGFDSIRVHEPCVVVSESVHRVYMHAVLSDERVYLTEHTPRTLAAAVSFRRVREIELVNDVPEFLSAKDRERCQHIRIVYVTDKPPARGRDWLRRNKALGLPAVAPPPRRISHCTSAGYPAESEGRAERATRSASCPNPETLGLLRVPPPSLARPRPLSSLSQDGVQRTFGSVLSRLLGREGADGGGGEEREAELHLYVVSRVSRLYLHLQSSWNSSIIRSTLLLDPLYRRKCSTSTDSSPGKQHPPMRDRTSHLLDQLTWDLQQVGIRVERLFQLLQELNAAAHRDVILRALFWRSGELCVFLVQTLEESLHGLSGASTADQLLLSTVIAETLAVMFRETQFEAARLHLLSAKKGALTSRMLLALICDPRPPQSSVIGSELQALLPEYLHAACSLLSELLLLGHETSRCSSADNFLSVGWILRVLQPHPHTLSFVSYQAQQVVLVLSDPPGSTALSPAHSVLLFQRCRLLASCLQHSVPLSLHLRSHLREEFRYFVRLGCVEEKLPPRYPITSATVRLLHSIQTLMLHE